MRQIAKFSVYGVDVCPWSVPDIGTSTNKAGKRFRFTKRTKKSNLATGSVNLDDWQALVRDKAMVAMSTVPVYTGPVWLAMQFHAATPPGCRDGQLWDVPMVWDQENGIHTKQSRNGKAEPDVTNMFKGTEDAVAGVCFLNDCQVRATSSIALYRDTPGVTVSVFAIEPEDYSGTGDPRPCPQPTPAPARTKPTRSSTPSARPRSGSPRKKKPQPTSASGSS